MILVAGKQWNEIVYQANDADAPNARPEAFNCEKIKYFRNKQKHRNVNDDSKES